MVWYGMVRYGTASAWYVTVWYATEALGMAREVAKVREESITVPVPVPVRWYCTVPYRNVLFAKV